MLLIERLAVVRELAAPDLGAAAQRAASRTSRDPRASAAPTATKSASPRARMPSACANSPMPPAVDDRRREARAAHRRADRRRERHVARERPARVGVDRRHALVARLGRCTDTPPSRPSAASRPRTCRPSRSTGSRGRRARTRRRTTPRRRAGCRLRSRHRRGSGSRRRRAAATRARTAAMTSRGNRTRCSRGPP